jgi:hypothetical protein
VSDFCKVGGYEEKMCMKSFVFIEDGEKIGLSHVRLMMMSRPSTNNKPQCLDFAPFFYYK